MRVSQKRVIARILSHLEIAKQGLTQNEDGFMTAICETCSATRLGRTMSY